MPDGQVLEFTRVTKRFNDVTAVSDFSARIEPGAVTAFLGPNGAGKTTTLRILLGQVRATSGTATIGGVAYPELRHPLRTIGSVFEETFYRPRRSAARHLTIAAKANGIPLSRVDEVLSLVGLENEAEGRIGSFSLGMRQRLSVANALLGDPGALVFDEPANGLDPEGIRWMRLLMRRLADEGRTVLVSSHVLSEVEQVADNVLVLSKGQLMLSSGIEKLADPSSGAVVVDAADRVALKTALASEGFEVEVLRSGLTVRGTTAGRVGSIAASAGIALTTLVQRGPTLEDVFIELVRGGRLAPNAEAVASALVAPQGGSLDDASSEGAAAAEAPPEEATSEQTPAEDAPSDGEPADDASDAEVSSDSSGIGSESDADGAPAPRAAESSPAAEPAEDAADATRSFDDILFGTATDEPATRQDEQDAGTDAGAGADEVEASGVEVFAALDETAVIPVQHAASGEGSPDEDHTSDDETTAERADDDPRAAAVSTMLAAAARAYYEDQPKDYPLADVDASSDADADAAGDADAEHRDGEAPDEGPHEHRDGEAQDEQHDEHRQDGEHDLH